MLDGNTRHCAEGECRPQRGHEIEARIDGGPEAIATGHGASRQYGSEPMRELMAWIRR